MSALDNIKVLDLTHLTPGALCTMILGDQGAEVIKIEALAEVGGRGASFRASPKGEERRREAAFNALNRNKKSLGLNLKSEAGRQIFYQLSQTADVIIEAFRPGVVKRLEVDYETISRINPGIVYCSLSGYGQDGPYRDLPGHDLIYVSVAGALGLMGPPDKPPVIPLNLLADYAGASFNGAIGILAALVARSKTGKGQYVDISFTDGVISLLTFYATDYFLNGKVPERGKLAYQGAYPYYGVYQTKDDKYISLGCIEVWFWQNLCRALGKEEYIPYHFLPEHGHREPEGDKWEEISSYLKQTFLTRTRDEWFEFLSEKDVPAGKVYSLDEVFSDPQVIHRQMALDIEHPDLGKVRQVGIAAKLSGTPGKVRSLSPLFGENTDEILTELGYKQGEIEGLRQSQAVG